MNKCILLGNLTRDPEPGSTANGATYCRFGIAVNRQFANANGERETDFFNIIAWRGLGDNCAKYLTKGSKVCVSGRVQIDSYEDKDGNKRQSVQIVAEDVEFVSSRSANSEGGSTYAPAPKNGSKNDSGLTPVPDDDLPF